MVVLCTGLYLLLSKCVSQCVFFGTYKKKCVFFGYLDKIGEVMIGFALAEDLIIRCSAVCVSSLFIFASVFLTIMLSKERIGQRMDIASWFFAMDIYYELPLQIVLNVCRFLSLFLSHSSRQISFLFCLQFSYLIPICSFLSLFLSYSRLQIFFFLADFFTYL